MRGRDLTGQQFNQLTVLYRAGANRQGSKTWVCRCQCGNETVLSTDHLTRKKNPVVSCGCQMHRSGPRHSQWKGCGDISGNWWYNHVLRERTQNVRERVPVTITIEEAWQLFQDQGGKCALSGVPLQIGYDYDGTASLDRIDSSLGYEPGNVQWVHKHINFMKRTYSQEYFIEMCRRVTEHTGACEVR